jgi:hypothetical protein
VTPTGRDGEHWLVLEHATRALSASSERKFRRYWRLIRLTERLSAGSCCARFDDALKALNAMWRLEMHSTLR